MIPPLVAPSAGSCAPFHLLERSDYAVFPPYPQERPPRSWRRWSQAIDSTTAMGRPMIQMASAFGEQERQIIRSRVNAGLERVRVQGTKLGHPKKGVAEDRGRHQEPSEHREWHPQGGCASRRRKRDCAASEKRDVEAFGRGGVISAIVPIMTRAVEPPRSVLTRLPQGEVCADAVVRQSARSPAYFFKRRPFAAHRRTQTVRPNHLRPAKLETGPNCARGSPATTAQTRSAGFSFANPIVKANHPLGLRSVSLERTTRWAHTDHSTGARYDGALVGSARPCPLHSRRTTSRRRTPPTPPPPFRL